MEGAFAPTTDGKAAVSTGGMVSTAFPDATIAGVQMLRRGGNAVDAACASAMALAVCEPQASGLGGQTIALVHVDGRTIALDGSSRAPLLASAPAFKTRSRFIGYAAATVPSTVATIGYLSERYGRLGWEAVIEPALRIARRGYRITKLQRDLQAANLQKFIQVPSFSGARYFLKDGQVPYDIGDLFVQDDLAGTLERLSRHGYRSFYCGEAASQMDADMRANDGYLRAEDLALLPMPVERKPVSAQYRGLQVCTTPLPGAGDAMLLALMMLRNMPQGRREGVSLDAYHYLAETFRKALLYGAHGPFDPVPHGHLPDGVDLGAGFAYRAARSIQDHIDPSLPLQEPTEGVGDTTHLSVIDAEDNAVSLTQSIETVYGSKAAADGLGFLYNSYISTFELDDPAHRFFLRPNSVPRSSVCPCIALLEGKPWIAVGSPGSERILSTVSLFLFRLLEGGNSIYEAMRRPRFHCSLGGRVSMEEGDGTAEAAAHLKQKGYNLDIRERHSFYLGAIHAALRRRDGSGFQGVADVRRDGTAEGPA